jgi:hypothetical protein
MKPRLRVIDCCVHSGVPGCILHLVELSLLVVELLLQLRNALQLPRLIAVVRSSIGIGAHVGELECGLEMVDSRLQRENLVFLCENLPLPLFCRSLFGKSLLRETLLRAPISRALFGAFVGGRNDRGLCSRCRLVCLRVLREILIRDHLGVLCGWAVGLLFPIFTGDVSQRLAIGRRDHRRNDRERDCQTPQ